MQRVPPRHVPSRDEFYMGEAFWVAAKSKDPNTQVGARIVSEENEPLGTGYNGPPSEMNDREINWGRAVKDHPDLETRLGKYPFMKHAEDNAIRRSKKKLLRGATIYVTAPPCRDCMLDIVDCGIKRVVYHRPQGDPASLTQSEDERMVTAMIAAKGGVALENFTGDLKWMVAHYQKLVDMGLFDGPAY
jgi:dCMP deaminase